MKNLIIKMANKNIGSLCLFLKNIKNIDYLDFINCNLPDLVKDRILSERIYYFVNDLKNIQLCECGKHKLFIGFKNGYRLTCGDKKCSSRKRKETCLEKYGVDNPKKSEEIIKKTNNRIIEKWEGLHYMKNEKVRDKFNKTMLNKYGVKWPQQSSEISEKSKDTFNKNPNKNLIIEKRKLSLITKSIEEKSEINLKKIKSIEEKWGNYKNFISYRLEKIKESSLSKYDTDHHFKNSDILEKRSQSYFDTITKKIIIKLPYHIVYLNREKNKNETDNVIKLHCLNCLDDFEINRQYLKIRCDLNKEICLNCNPILSGKSNMEIELYNFIRLYYIGDIISNSKNIISSELDIYLPDLQIGFEFNGLYWHSEVYKDKNYHLNKTKECQSKGIQLIHIWEDDWVYKQDIVKSMILNKLEKSEKIYARKCQIIEITDNNIIRNFLDKNHIQGFVGSKIKIGLYYNHELVSLMTFGNLRKSLGQASKDGSFELLRFCNKLGITVVGGSSKLFNYFLHNYNVKEIISYSDNSRSNGNMYKKIGFDKLHESKPNYYYIINGIKKHRFNFRKDKLTQNGEDKNKTEIQIMSDKGHPRIFDCGMSKWVYIKKENPLSFE
jgi:hypothetical protein